MFAETQIWEDATTGEMWLVSVWPEDNSVVTALGPMSKSEAEYCVNEAGGNFAGNDEDKNFVRNHEADFRIVYCALCIREM